MVDISIPKGRKLRVRSANLRRSSRERLAPSLPTPVMPPLTVKRGRGRPPKKTKEVTKIDEESTALPKARRGRPKRETHVLMANNVSKPRGRRPKDVKVTTPSPKPRGRPPKNANMAKSSPVAVSKVRSLPKAVKLGAAKPPTTGRLGRPPTKASAANVAQAQVKPGHFSIDNIQGTFRVECHALEASFNEDETYDFSFSIGEPEEDDRVEAAFDFGVINGVLRLAPSKEALAVWCNSAASQDEIHCPATPRASPAAGSKRTRGGIDRTRQVDSKRVKIDGPAHAHRVFFRWRGQDPVDEAVYSDDKAQVGWLDFARTDGSVFWGVIDVPGHGGAGIAIHGVRTSKEPAFEPLGWDAFDGTASAEVEDDTADDPDEDADAGANDYADGIAGGAPTAVMTTIGDSQNEDGEDDFVKNDDVERKTTDGSEAYLTEV